MPDHLGTTHNHNHNQDQDHRDLGHNLPGEQGLPCEDTDKPARNFAARCLWIGLGIEAGTSLTALAYATDLARGNLGVNADLRMVLMFGVVCVIATGAGLIIIGGIDRLLRPLRAMDRQRAIVAQDIHSHAIADSNRIDRIEHAIDAIADHMPDNNQIHNWKGYSAAVRKGFTEERTGTEGPPPPAPRHPRPRGLGLVSRNDPPTF